jgi:hypothetical protein
LLQLLTVLIVVVMIFILLLFLLPLSLLSLITSKYAFGSRKRKEREGVS